jgi:hypothetical protein
MAFSPYGEKPQNKEVIACGSPCSKAGGRMLPAFSLTYPNISPPKTVHTPHQIYRSNLLRKGLNGFMYMNPFNSVAMIHSHPLEKPQEINRSPNVAFS